MDKQLTRIKEKLAQSRIKDEEFAVFGADSHGYEIGDCTTIEAVQAFEQKNKIKLPEAYVAFITQIGNGNPDEEAYMGSAAGPYYGIYPLGEGVEDLLAGDAKRYLSYPCILQPDMTDEAWQVWISGMYEEDLSDEGYEAIVGPLFGGLLPLGTQGCAITTCLVLNGPYYGRIVYLNDEYKPVFAYEANFLDWYERWLDEIISGELLTEHAGWFGYKRGGTAAFLWNAFQTSTTEKEQVEYLEGLIGKKNIQEEIIQALIETIPQATISIRQQLISILAKVDYRKSIPFLEEEVKENVLFVLQQIHWYGSDEAHWIPLLEAYKDQIEEEETYRFYTYVALKATTDFASLLLPGLASAHAAIRSQAIYSLGQLKTKQDYVSSFITALQDEDENVVLYSLQGLQGVKDERLLSVYTAVYHKYKESVEENYILMNLNHRLKELDITFEDIAK